MFIIKCNLEFFFAYILTKNLTINIWRLCWLDNFNVHHTACNFGRLNFFFIVFLILFMIQHLNHYRSVYIFTFIIFYFNIIVIYLSDKEDGNVKQCRKDFMWETSWCLGSYKLARHTQTHKSSELKMLFVCWMLGDGQWRFKTSHWIDLTLDPST